MKLEIPRQSIGHGILRLSNAKGLEEYSWKVTPVVSSETISIVH